MKQDVMFRIIDIIDRHGAEIAFPTRTLHMAETPEGHGDAAGGETGGD